MAREKLSIAPLALVGICLTLVGMTAYGTAYIISLAETSKVSFLEEQIIFLKVQKDLQIKEVNEKEHILRLIRSVTKDSFVTKLIDEKIEDITKIVDQKVLKFDVAFPVNKTPLRLLYEERFHPSTGWQSVMRFISGGFFSKMPASMFRKWR